MISSFSITCCKTGLLHQNGSSVWVRTTCPLTYRSTGLLCNKGRGTECFTPVSTWINTCVIKHWQGFSVMLCIFHVVVFKMKLSMKSVSEFTSWMSSADSGCCERDVLSTGASWSSSQRIPLFSFWISEQQRVYETSEPAEKCTSELQGHIFNSSRCPTCRDLTPLRDGEKSHNSEARNVKMFSFLFSRFLNLFRNNSLWWSEWWSVIVSACCIMPGRSLSASFWILFYFEGATFILKPSAQV